MSTSTLREILGWCSIMNIGLLWGWFLIFAFAHDFIYRTHSRWFNIPKETFNTIHYAGITFFKIAIFVFNIVPYLVLRIIE